MCILLQVTDDVQLRGRIQHAKQLLWHTIHHGWASARSFHYEVLRDIEAGTMTWNDLQEMQALALAAAESSTSSTVTRKKHKVQESHTSTSDKQPAIFCYLYNNDINGCNNEKEFGQCKKLHACGTCTAKGFLSRHRSAFDCKK